MNPLKSLVEYYIQKMPHKGKRYTVKWVLRCLPLCFVRSYYGPEMACNPKDKTNVYGISGEYGNVISNHVNSLPKDACFIDIGANYGIFSLLAASVLKTGQVVSFEPNPAIYSYFLKSVIRNGFKNVLPFHCAIGEKNEILNLAFDENHSGLSHLSADKSGFNVPVFNISQWNLLDDILELHYQVHIKIDVEGYEQGIINALRQTKWFKLVQSVVVEIDDENLRSFGASAQSVYDSLSQEGFTPSIGFDDNKHYDEIFIRQPK